MSALAIDPPASGIEAAYRASITTHYPNVDPLSLAVRVELMQHRDKLSAALRVCCDDAFGVLSEALRLSSNYALSGASTKQLMHVNAAVCTMIEAARGLERGCVK